MSPDDAASSTEEDGKPRPHGVEHTRGRQFSLRSLWLVTTAAAWWMWLLTDLDREEWWLRFALLLLAMLLGACAHAVYVLLLPWRGTGFVVCWLLAAGYLCAGAMLTQSHSLGQALQATALALRTPLDVLRLAPADGSRWAVLPFLMTTLLFSLAHPVRPSLPMAFVTALGVLTWFGLVMLLLMPAG